MYGGVGGEDRRPPYPDLIDSWPLILVAAEKVLPTLGPFSQPGLPSGWRQRIQYNLRGLGKFIRPEKCP
jgi:hypothetical protein